MQICPEGGDKERPKVDRRGSGTPGPLPDHVYLYDMPLATVQPTDTVYYFHTDHINTPRVMTNSAGTVAWQAAYHGFGHAEVDVSSTITNNIRFPGQYFDAETNLHYNWNRYYDPRTGRYLTPDPIGLEGGIDPYVYVDNRPVNLVDLKGLKTWIFMSTSGSGGAGPVAGEGGTYYLIDPSTGRYHQFGYISLGVGLGFGGAVQVEGGTFEGPCNPRSMSNWSLSVSGFAAAGKGAGAQYTGTSFWGSGENGWTGGVAAGAGAGVAGMATYSWYIKSGDVLPRQLQQVYEHILNNQRR